MKKILISDFSKVLLFPKDSDYKGGLNKLYDQILSGDENFNDYFELNESLLSELEELDVERYIFTMGKVQNAPELKDKLKKVFKNIFNVPMIGYHKTDNKAYTTLCNEIGIDPAQAIFIDDTKENVVAAREAGLHAIVYENNSQILRSIIEWLK